MKSAVLSSVLLTLAAGAYAAAIPQSQQNDGGQSGSQLGPPVPATTDATNPGSKGPPGPSVPNALARLNRDISTLEVTDPGIAAVIMGDAINLMQQVAVTSGTKLHKRQDLQSAIAALIAAAQKGDPKNPADVGTVINDAFNIAQEGVNLGTGSQVHKRQASDLQGAIEALVNAARSADPKNPADVGTIVNDAFNVAQESVNVGTGSQVHKRQSSGLQGAIEALIAAAGKADPKNPADVGTIVNDAFNIAQESVNLGTGSQVHKRQAGGLQGAIEALVAAAQKADPKNPADVGTIINDAFNIAQESVNLGTGSQVHKRQNSGGLQGAIEALIAAAGKADPKNPADVGTIVNDAFNIAQEGVNLGTGSQVHKRQNSGGLQGAIEALVAAAQKGDPKNPADVGTVVNDAFNIVRESINLGTGSQVHKRQQQPPNLQTAITDLVNMVHNVDPNNVKPSDVGSAVNGGFNIAEEAINLGTGSNIHKRQDLQSAIQALIAASQKADPKNPADVGTIVNDAFNIAQESVNLGTGSKVHKRTN